MVLIAFLIILLLIIRDREEKKKLEIEEKKKNIIGYDTRTGVALYKGERVVGYNTQTGQPIIEGREEPKKEEKPIDKSKISNSVLMIVGAGLIVFATAVFLTSSWDSIPNIIKPFILVFIQLVFFGSYKICINKLDIPKTGKVFKFLAFMFIPIVLISLSCFELIGEELSINGEYANLYFGLSLLISDIIYKIYDHKFPDMVIKRTSYFLEAAAVFCFSDLFKEDPISIIICSIYTAVIHVLLHNNIMDKKAYYVPNLIATGFMMLCALVLALDVNEFVYYLPFAVYTVLYFVMYVINKEEKTQKLELYFFIINYMAFVSSIKLLTIPNQFIYLLCLIPFIILAKITKRLSLREVLIWIVFGLTTVIMHSTLARNNMYYDLLAIALAGGIYCSLFAITNKLRPVFKCFAYLSMAYFFDTLCVCLNIPEVSKYVLLLVALFIYLLEAAFPILKDATSKHLIPVVLSVESIILGLIHFGTDANYAVLIPLVLMIIYTKVEKTEENYVFVPALLSLSLFCKGTEVIDICICSTLVLIYSILSALKRKENLYTFISLLTIIAGLPFIKADAYVVFITLAIWSLIHYMMYEKHKELFKLTAIISIFGLYTKLLIDLEVSYVSLYFLGALLALIAISKLVFKKDSQESTFFEIIGFIILTLVSLILVNEAIDAVIMIVIYFVLVLFAYVNKFKVLVYCSLVAMIVHIIKQTLEFWSSIPIYIYVLLIGLALILFAMFDERLNIIKKKKEKPEKIEEKNNIE